MTSKVYVVTNTTNSPVQFQISGGNIVTVLGRQTINYSANVNCNSSISVTVSSTISGISGSTGTYMFPCKICGFNIEIFPIIFPPGGKLFTNAVPCPVAGMMQVGSFGISLVSSAVRVNSEGRC